MNAIQVQKLTRKFKDYRAVDDLTFSVSRGEIYGFLGPNGAGKTTTIRMLTGQLHPTSGSATVAGYDIITERHDLKSRIGVVFEYQNIYETLSARENLRFSARLYGIQNTRVEAVLQQVGLEQHANKPTRTFSNGMKQRLLIARALLHKPAVLFMDEPTRGLDPQIAQDIRTLISQLATDGTTIFLTTHYMYEADALCDRVAIINRGHMIAEDTPANLKLYYGKDSQASLEDVFIALTGNTITERQL